MARWLVVDMAAKAAAFAFGFGSSSSGMGEASACEVGAEPDRVDMPVNDGGSGLRAYLLAQYKAGCLSAKAVCDLAWHSIKAWATAQIKAEHGNFTKEIQCWILV